MAGVNLNSPDLKLARFDEQAPARASVLPRAEVAEGSYVQLSSSAPLKKPYGVTESEGSKVLLDPRGADRVDEAVSQLNDFVQNVQRDLQFEVDRDLGETIVRVIDRETQEVIRQIPDEVALKLAEKLQQDEPLTLFEVKV